MNDVDSVNQDRLGRLTSQTEWLGEFRRTLETYPMCYLNDADNLDLDCQVVIVGENGNRLRKIVNVMRV